MEPFILKPIAMAIVAFGIHSGEPAFTAQGSKFLSNTWTNWAKLYDGGIISVDQQGRISSSDIARLKTGDLIRLSANTKVNVNGDDIRRILEKASAVLIEDNVGFAADDSKTTEALKNYNGLIAIKASAQPSAFYDAAKNSKNFAAELKTVEDDHVTEKGLSDTTVNSSSRSLYLTGKLDFELPVMQLIENNKSKSYANIGIDITEGLSQTAAKAIGNLFASANSLSLHFKTNSPRYLQYISQGISSSNKPLVHEFSIYGNGNFTDVMSSYANKMSGQFFVLSANPQTLASLNYKAKGVYKNATIVSETPVPELLRAVRSDQVGATYIWNVNPSMRKQMIQSGLGYVITPYFAGKSLFWTDNGGLYKSYMRTFKPEPTSPPQPIPSNSTIEDALHASKSGDVFRITPQQALDVWQKRPTSVPFVVSGDKTGGAIMHTQDNMQLSF